MRSVCFALSLAVFGCGEPKSPPSTNKTSPTPSSIPTKDSHIKPITPATTVTPASTPASATSASAPTSMAAIKPWLEQPTAPPAEGALQYDEWFKVNDFPAISSDGKLFVTIVAEGYDERDEIGDTVDLIVFSIDDNKIKQTINLLTPKETYEDTPKKIRDKLQATIKPRIEEAQKTLTGITWLPLEPLEITEENVFAKGTTKLSFSEEKDNTLTIEADGKQVKEQKFPAWTASKSPACKEGQFIPDCDCGYPIILSEAMNNPQLRVIMVTVGYMITHTCEAPPDSQMLAFRY